MTDYDEVKKLYSYGRHYWNMRNEQGYEKALNYFQQAIEKDPNFAMAYVGIADVCNLLGFHGIKPLESRFHGIKLPESVFHGNKPHEDAYKIAELVANKALEIDQDLAGAHTSLAWISLYHDWNWTEAETRFRHAIDIDPCYPLARLWYKDFLLVMGRGDEAIEQMEECLKIAEMNRCHELDQMSVTCYKFLMVTYIIAEKYDRAWDLFNVSIDLFPNHPFPYDIISRSYVQQGISCAQQGMPNEALNFYNNGLENIQKARDLSGDPSFKEDVFGIIYAFKGETEKAERILDKLFPLYEEHTFPPSRIALIYRGMEEIDKAFEWLDRAYAERDSQLVYLKSFPEWQFLRLDSRCTDRYNDLLKKIGLPEN